MEYWNCASCRMTFLLFPAIFVGVETKRRSMETVFDASGALELSESNKSNVSNEATVPPAAMIVRRGCINSASAGGISSDKVVSQWLKEVLEEAITETSDTLELMLCKTQKKKKKKKKKKNKMVGSTDSGHLLADSNLSNLSDSQSIKITRMSMPCGKSLLDKFKNGILAELDEGFYEEESNTSRSGAAFFWSRNRKFILKTMPSKKEFDFLSQKPSLFEAYFQTVGDNELKTSINPVLLSFQTVARTGRFRMGHADTKYWVLMPAESVSTMLVSASEEGKYELTTDGNKMMGFDVKPEPIHSDQRRDFFKDVGKRTGGFGFGKLWDNHDMQMATITRDVEFLECPTCFLPLQKSSVGAGKPARLIDYSIFPMFQGVTIKRTDVNMEWKEIFEELKRKLPRCLWETKGEVKPGEMQVDFMCVAIIDYLMNWPDLAWGKRNIENNLPLIYKKWNNWGSKIIELFVCMSYPCAKARQATEKAKKRVYEFGDTYAYAYVNGCHAYRQHFVPKVSREECDRRLEPV